MAHDGSGQFFGITFLLENFISHIGMFLHGRIFFIIEIVEEACHCPKLLIFAVFLCHFAHYLFHSQSMASQGI